MATESRVPWGFSWPKVPALALDAFKYVFARGGIYSSQLIESGGFMRTEPGLERPDIQFALIPGHRAPRLPYAGARPPSSLRSPRSRASAAGPA